MPLAKPAPIDHPILPLLIDRWSPRAFDPRPVPAERLRALFEAARWAPSSSNQQPWRFVVATIDGEPEAHARIAACLSDGNRRWAHRAPVLVIACTKLTIEHPERPTRDNPHAVYDLGQAVAHLSVQATAEGLFVHQMGGFDAAAARATCAVPDGFAPHVAIALGYGGDVAALDDDLQVRETAVRLRRPMARSVFGGTWDTTAAWAPERRDDDAQIQPAR